jgi:GNAT superfamily N-acetyltransferase
MSSELPRPSGARDLFPVVDATWPAAEYRTLGPWLLRRGGGGGNRVSAATLEREGAADPAPADPALADPAPAEAAMRAWGQAPLFLIRPGEDALDTALARRGYQLRDAVVMLAASVDELAPEAPDPLVIVGEAPLAIMAEIWRAGGIGAGRLAVMERVSAPRAFLFGRDGDRPAGCAFVAAAGDVAMVHAVEVAQSVRRKGVGGRMMRAAARWARRQGARRLAVAVARDNVGGRGLYAALGITEAASYHYRVAGDG